MTDTEDFELALSVIFVIQWLTLLATPFVELPNWLRTALYGGLATTFLIFGVASETVLDEDQFGTPGSQYLVFAFYVLFGASLVSTALAPVPFLGTNTMLIGAWLALFGAFGVMAVNEFLFTENTDARDPTTVPDDPMEMIDDEA